MNILTSKALPWAMCLQAFQAALRIQADNHFYLFVHFLPIQATLQSVIPLYSKYGKSSVLASLRQSEKDGPQYAFGSRTDRKQHLCEGQDIKGYAAQQDNDTYLKRKGLQPLSYFHTNSQQSRKQMIVCFFILSFFPIFLNHGSQGGPMMAKRCSAANGAAAG